MPVARCRSSSGRNTRTVTTDEGQEAFSFPTHPSQRFAASRKEHAYALMASIEAPPGLSCSKHPGNNLLTQPRATARPSKPCAGACKPSRRQSAHNPVRRKGIYRRCGEGCACLLGCEPLQIKATVQMAISTAAFFTDLKMTYYLSVARIWSRPPSHSHDRSFNCQAGRKVSSLLVKNVCQWFQGFYAFLIESPTCCTGFA